MPETTLIIGLTGMPGSGKTLVARALERRGFASLTLSRLMTEALRHRDEVAFTRERWRLSRELREKYGSAFLAERAWKQLAEDLPAVAVLDGIRSLAECAYLSQRAPLRVVAFQRPCELRYRRLLAGEHGIFRREPHSITELDAHELSLGVGHVIALADYVHFSFATEETLLKESERAAIAIENYAQEEGASLKSTQVAHENRTDYSKLQALIASFG